MNTTQNTARSTDENTLLTPCADGSDGVASDRRRLLKLAGMSLAAAPFAGIRGLIGEAMAQPVAPVASAVSAAPAIQLPQSHQLAQVAIAQAKRFQIGKESISLDLDLGKKVVATVVEFPLPEHGARRLNRTKNVVESAMIPLVRNSKSAKVIQSTYARYGVSKAVIDDLEFTSVTARRRISTAADRLNIGKKVPVAKPVTMIVGYSTNDDSAYFLLPTLTRNKKAVQPPILKIADIASGIAGASKGEGGGSAATTDPPEAGKEDFDFGKCFGECATNTQLLFGSLAAALGTACIAAIAALGPSASISAIIAIPSCIGTIAVLAAWVLGCLAVCGIDAAV